MPRIRLLTQIPMQRVVSPEANQSLNRVITKVQQLSSRSRLSLTRNSQQLTFNRGVAKRLTGDKHGSLADFRKTIEVDPTPINAEAWYDRGTAKSFTGYNNGALADYTNAIDLNPAYGQAYAHRGKIKETTGDEQGAALDYKYAEKFHGTLQ